MATKVGDVFAELRLKADKADADLKSFRKELKVAGGELGKAEKKTETFGKRLKRLGKVAKNAGGTVAKGMAVATAAIGVGAAAAFTFVKRWSAVTDTLGKTAQQVNTTAAELQGLQFAAGISGESGESVLNAIKQFAKLSTDAREKGVTPFTAALFQLGLSFKDLDDKSFTERFALVSDRLKNVKDDATRTSIALRLFGRDSQRLGNTLSLGSEKLNDLIGEFHELGGTISEEALAAAADFNDESLRLQTVLQGVKNIIGARLAPVITAMITRFRRWTKANKDLIATRLEKFLKSSADAAVRLIPKIVELAEQIISLVTSIGGIEQAFKVVLGGLVIFKLAFVTALGPAGPIAAAILGIILLFDTLASRVEAAKRKTEEFRKSASKSKTLLDDPDFDPTELSKNAQRRITDLNREQKALKEQLATRAKLRKELPKTGTVAGRFGETTKVVPKRVLKEFDRITDEFARDILQLEGKISTIVAADRSRERREQIKGQRAKVKEDERRAPLIAEFQKLAQLFTRGKATPAQEKRLRFLSKDLQIDIPTKIDDPFADRPGAGGADKPQPKTPSELIREALGGGGKLGVGGLVPSGPGTTINHNNFTINLAPADIDIIVKGLPQNATASDVAQRVKDAVKGAVSESVREAYDLQVRQVVG